MISDSKNDFIKVTFGSVTIRTERPSPEEVAKNILAGQMALASALKVLKNKGIKLNLPKGTALYQANPNNPVILLRNIDGNIDQGIFENGQFQVIYLSE